MWKSKFYGAFVLNRRVVLHAIDESPARWRGGAGSSSLDGSSAATSSPRNDLVKNYRVHPTHWLISTQASATLTALKKKYKSLQGAVDAGWRFVDGDGVDVKPGKMSGPHFFIEPGGSVAMSSTTALHAVNE